MIPTLRPGSLCGIERFGAFDLLQLVYVAVLKGWGWTQGPAYTSATLPILLSPGPLRVSVTTQKLSCAVSLLELTSLSSCHVLPFPTSMTKTVSLTQLI